MYKANLVPLFDTIRHDLECWNSLPISLLGRISLLKMNILPRLLYPIQMIPVLLSNKVIRYLKGWLNSRGLGSAQYEVLSMVCPLKLYF
jgi:hypothetical protein